MTQNGLVEVPRTYTPHKWEYWSNGEVLVWASPRKDPKTWNLYVSESVQVAAEFPDQGLFKEVDQKDAKAWVATLGLVFATYLGAVKQ